jgi:GT2 family glycosyltransferase
MPSEQHDAIAPVKILEAELTQPLPTIDPTAYDRPYHKALLLVRIQGRPIGRLEVALDYALTPDALAHRIETALHDAIAAYFAEAGLPAAQTLTAQGFTIPLHVPQDPRPFVSVIVATRDRPDRLRACLQTLLAQDYPQFDVVVVDNAPKTSATADLIANEFGRYTQICYVREDKPGLTNARNAGLAVARGEITAITDDDVLADRLWLSTLVQAFKVGQNVACVTGLILPAELETPTQVWLEQFGGFSKGYQTKILDLADHRPVDHLFPYTVGQCGSGANMAFKTDVLRNIGGFDPALGAGTLGIGGEDLAIFHSVITAHYQLVYEPAALVYHFHPSEYRQLQRMLYNYGVGLTAFVTKTIVDKPASIVELILKLPRGVLFALSPGSPKNRAKQTNYPKELTYLELRGMLYGPIAYLRSRWHIRQTSHAS